MIKNTLAVSAATLLAFSSIAAQANTRAFDAGISIDRAAASTANASMLANDDDDDDDAGLYLLLIALLIGGGIAAVVAGDASEGNDASPGTGG